MTGNTTRKAQKTPKALLLAMDVGNTNTVLGVFDKHKLVMDWRIRTDRNITEDEFNVLVNNLLAGSRISPKNITRTIISCVVPPIVGILDSFCLKYLRHQPLWVSAETVGKMPILYRNPFEVGADRIVNAIAAYNKYRSALIVIDFGTATTFDVISAQGEYLGGAISPGIMIAAEALYQNASKLPRVEIFQAPETVIGKDTENSIKAGIIYGYAGLVDGLVARMVTELETLPKVIATGGLAALMSEVSATIEAVEPHLTLYGLQIISENHVAE